MDRKHKHNKESDRKEANNEKSSKLKVRTKNMLRKKMQKLKIQKNAMTKKIQKWTRLGNANSTSKSMRKKATMKKQSKQTAKTKICNS